MAILGNATPFDFQSLINIVNTAVTDAKAQLDAISNNTDAVSISQMFGMQMKMNHLSQMSEMSTSVVNAANSSTVSMARNVKG